MRLLWILFGCDFIEGFLVKGGWKVLGEFFYF